MCIWPKIFNDHMVLQRQKPVPIWGTADTGKQVTVVFAGQTRTAAADAEGNWLVEFEPMEASSEGGELVVKSGGHTMIVKDVLVGEVWLTPGQSTMEYPLIHTEEGNIDILAADSPQIRFFMPACCAERGVDDFSPASLEDFINESNTPCSNAIPRNGCRSGPMLLGWPCWR